MALRGWSGALALLLLAVALLFQATSGQDEIEVGFERTSIEVVEGMDPVMETVSVNRTLMADEFIILGVMVINSTGYDITVSPAVLYFNETSSSRQNITITIVDDNLVEGDQTVTVMLVPVEINVTAPSADVNDMLDVMIMDDDREVILNVTSPVGEDVGTVMVCAMTSPVALVDLTVYISTVDGTATSTAPMDYVGLMNVPLTIFSGSTYNCTTVSIYNDTIVEDDESFYVVMTTNDSRVTISNNMTRVTIQSDPTDTVTVTLAIRDIYMFESSSNFTLDVYVTPNYERSVTVSLNVFRVENPNIFKPIQLSFQDPTAGSAMYSHQLTRNITFTPGNTPNESVTVFFRRDPCLQVLENLTFNLSTSDSAVVLADLPSNIHVFDDNDYNITIGFNTTMSVVNEGGAAMIPIAILDGCIGTPVYVTVSLTPSDMMNVLSLSPSMVTFDNTGVVRYINLTAMSDMVLEYDVNFTLRISNPLPTEVAGRVILSPDTLNIAAVDDPTAVEIGLTMSSYNVSEGSSLEVCVGVVSGSSLQREVTARVTVANGTAYENVDFTRPSPYMVTLNSSTPSSCVTIDTTSNGVVEEDKMFTVGVAMAMVQPMGVTVMPSMASVNIMESDSITIGLTEMNVDVTEGNSFQVYVALTNGTLNRDVVVVVSSMNGTAGSTADFSPVYEQFTFSSSQSMFRVDVSTMTDSLTDENSEMFTISLMSPSLSPPTLVLDPDTTTVTIIDAPFISQQPMDQFVLEGETATFMVMVSGSGLSYQWFRNESMLADIPGKVSGSSNAILTVYNVATEDLGYYFCIVSNRAANITSNNASLSFVPMPMNLRVPGNTGVLVNQSLTLSCSVESQGGPADISFTAVTSDGQNITLPEVEMEVSGFLTVVNITIDDIDDSFTGIYSCVATNRASMVSQSFNVSVITIVGVNDVVAIPGQNVSFFCDASGDPGLMYRWAVVLGNNLTTTTNIGASRFPNSFADGRVSGEDTANLMIFRVSRGDVFGMRVACTVSLFGKELDTVFGGFEVLSIELIQGPVNQTIRAGENVTLTCTARNFPQSLYPLVFMWTANTTRVAETDRISINQSDPDSNRTVTSSLTIRDTVFTDNGRYRCTVYIVRPQDNVQSEIVNLVIQFAPVVTSILIEVPSSGDFLDPLDSGIYRVDAQSSGNRLVAFPIAQPLVTVDGVRLYRLGSDDTREGVYNCSLDANNAIECYFPVLNVSQSDLTFELFLSNAIGNGSRRFQVRVQGVPDPVDLALLTSKVPNLLEVTLTWRRPNSNNADIRSYTVSFCHMVSSQCTLSNAVIPVNSSDLMTGTGTGTNEGMVTYTIRHRVSLNVSISVNISATNRVGNGDSINGPATVAVATTADATPINVRLTALTNEFAVVAWDLPNTAMGAGIVIDQYSVMVSFMGNRNSNLTNSSSDTRAVMLTPALYPQFMSSGYIIITVTAQYRTPAFTATASEFMFRVPAENVMATPLVTGTAGNNRLSPTMATITWMLPDENDREFLENIRVTHISVPIIQVESRKRRAANMEETISLNNDATSTNIPTEPYSIVRADVDAIYQGGVSIPLIMSAIFQSQEAKPTPPRSLQVSTDGVHSLQCEWLAPNPTNGLIVGYELLYYIVGTPANRAQTVTLGDNTTSGTITNLDANTEYVVRVIAVNRADDPRSEASQPQNGKTGFGVSPPTSLVILPDGTTNGVFSVQFTVSKTDGPIERFQIIVSTTRLTNSRSMTNIGAYTSGASVYVTRAGTVSSDNGNTMVLIGTEGTSQEGSTQYADQRLQGNTDYYVIVRLFSSINITIFNDSAISSPIRYNPGLNVVAVIAPIAAIAGILIIVLIVLLVVAYCTMASPMKRFGGYVVTNNVERRQGGGKGGGMEMRRTRMFSPVLHVGTSDAFTSANQPTTLICEASGTPTPTVSWTRNGEPLDKERFIQLADDSLFINDTDLQDEGTYVVKAVNSAGEAEEMVRMTVLRPVPPENDPDHPPIKVGEFSEKIALVRAEDDEGLEDEYTEVELDWTFTSYAAKLNVNKNKNRYINIIPYDHSRVVLSLQDNTPGSDYINASFIDAYQRPNGYIASQGPIPSTFPDFWRMIWELDAPTIVMVTNLKEEDKIKCHQYWPSYGTTTYGNIQVTLKEVENLAEYSIRTFNVSPLAGQSRVQMPVREVRQFHFLVWPDHGVPTYATNLLSFRKRILKYHPEKRGPMVVHCSAGVGRTGTFITIDYMLKQMEAEGTINIFNFVRHMRYRRNYMVQTSPQYVFIHDALLESIMCGDNSIKAPELKKKVEELRQVVPETGVSMFETQFNTLKTASPPDEDFDCSIARLPDNEPKNRSKVNLPSNDFRVVLSAEKEQSDYICASYVDNYRERNAFIVTQGPLQETAKDFWRMIWETKSAAIVMLTELTEDGQEMCVKYWPSSKGEPDVYGGYQVQLSEDEKDRGDYITRKFKLSPVDNPQESRMVSQFHFTRWSKTLPPKDCRPMIDLIDELQRVQRKSGNMPITVHCDDGIGRTGAFCTLYSVLERVKTEQIVDVFQAVKTLRIQRTGLMATISEYEFVHCAVIEFLETFSEYQNFK